MRTDESTSFKSVSFYLNAFTLKKLDEFVARKEKAVKMKIGRSAALNFIIQDYLKSHNTL